MLTFMFTLCSTIGVLFLHGIQGYPELSSSSELNQGTNNTIPTVLTTIVSSLPSPSSSSNDDSVKYKSGNNTDEVAAREFLRTQEIEAVKYCRQSVLAEWNYSSNLTEHNKQVMVS